MSSSQPVDAHIRLRTGSYDTHKFVMKLRHEESHPEPWLEAIFQGRQSGCLPTRHRLASFARRDAGSVERRLEPLGLESGSRQNRRLAMLKRHRMGLLNRTTHAELSRSRRFHHILLSCLFYGLLGAS